jgi:hypothetical protein
MIFRNHLSDVSGALTELGLHTFPDFKVNYGERLNFTRGFAAALSVLKNIFKDHDQLINELQEQDEFNKAIKSQEVNENED